MTTHPSAGTIDWGRSVAELLNEDGDFRSAAAGWDDCFGIGTETAVAYFRIYRGTVIDVTRRPIGRPAFVTRAAAETWQRLLSDPTDGYFIEAMRGSFRTEGDGYEYVRLAKVLDLVIRAAQRIAGLQPLNVVEPRVPLEQTLDSGWRAIGRYLEIDGSLGYIEEHRSGGPELGTIIALHTAGQGGEQYRRVAPQLALLGYRVLVPDFPGHGRSEPAIDGPIADLGCYAQWCVDVLERFEVDTAYIVGCSIGGKIALDLAHRLGPRALGAIAMAASADPGRSNRATLLRELEDIGAPSRSDRTYLGTHAVVGRAVPPPTRELIALMHRREDPQVSTSDLLGWNAHDLRPVLDEITCPVRLVGGTDDLWLDLDAVRRTAEALPNAELTVLAGIGHYPHQELADFADRVHDWISAWSLAGDRDGKDIAYDRA